MQFINCSYKEFVNKIENRRIIQFGASTGWKYHETLFPNIFSEVIEKTDYIVDNSSEKIGEMWDVLGKSLQIKNPQELCKEEQPIILITVRLTYQDKICEQLLNMDLAENAECYSLHLMIYEGQDADNRCVSEYFKMHKEMQIPKKIHSFWFSGEEKPDKYKKCIESWYKFCPDFEIHEWNCENYDVNKNEFMRQALECRKWAFVSDYARIDVVHQYGGFYFDMDVELIAPIEELCRANSFFCMQDDGLVELGSGFGAIKKHPFLEKILDFYKDRKFLKEDGTMELTPQPALLMPLFHDYGVKTSHDSQMVKDTLFLSNDYFTCISGDPSEWKWKGTEKGIHWHASEWMSSEKRQLLDKDQMVRKVIMNKYFTT